MIPIAPESLALFVLGGATLGLVAVVVAFVLVLVWDFNRRWVREAPIHRAVIVYVRKIIPQYNWRQLIVVTIKAVGGGAIGGMLLLTLLLGGEVIAAYHL